MTRTLGTASWQCRGYAWGTGGTGGFGKEDTFPPGPRRPRKGGGSKGGRKGMKRTKGSRKAPKIRTPRQERRRRQSALPGTSSPAGADTDAAPAGAGRPPGRRCPQLTGGPGSVREPGGAEGAPWCRTGTCHRPARDEARRGGGSPAWPGTALRGAGGRGRERDRERERERERGGRGSYRLFPRPPLGALARRRVGRRALSEEFWLLGKTVENAKRNNKAC
ncbi:myb/SANT-like DNA-binding domain-containing protein 3 isoform X3 [Zonotrichia albicollis]|uniref:myb/SANT-like DNA-binding domain-containing protein 3 isoform X3 n=1 Tax=Zonotrichia albicollis TaxID=44394 RepID=UPI003D8124B5